MHVVIVGNGIAGIEAALTLRRRQPTWRITVVSEESDHLFSRTALMWVLSGQLSYQDIEPYERDLYERQRFERVRARALGVDVTQRQLRLAGTSEPLRYDRLLIACGSRARPPPWPGGQLSGVGHFVTLQDLAWLERELCGQPLKARPEREDAHLSRTSERSPYRPRPPRDRGTAGRLVVIGGGLVGIEVVEVAVARGLQPDFVVREEWFWPMALDAREARWIAQRMREHGVRVHFGVEGVSLEGDEGGFVRAVRTNQGELACDLCVVAIGVVPNTEWLDGSALERDASGALTVDEHLKASADGVFAAGDCAATPQPGGGLATEPLWYAAREQGRVAGRALAGEDVRYARGVPYNSAKLMDIEYTTVGEVPREPVAGGDWYFEEEGRVRSTLRLVHEQGRLTGFNALGRRWDNEVITRWIQEGCPLEVALHHLRDAAFDTELVPPLRVPEERLRT